VAGCCEHSNEFSGLIRDWKFLDLPINCYILRKESTPRNQSVS
jgi:hypothetical protein